MDREILFRAKRADGNGYDGEWIYGYGATGDQIIHLDIYAGFIGVKVDPSTVGQYTGLTDKNGVKIFKGDIVRFPWGLSQATDAVIFRDGGFTLAHYWWATVCDGKAETIGNIHDNPELIGGEDDG